ncbi:glycosyltransferase family 2 protein [Vibrio sp. TBV020]|uniref:glycosyltransferase family 2 protein n=1 Tax=Vibrio sp. TBV020 TaxID=3137398 RepID=UPI0038CD7351
MDTSLSFALDLLNQSNTHFDLTNSQHQSNLIKLAEKLEGLHDLSNEHLRELTTQFNGPLEFQLATMLVESRRAIESVQKPIKIGVVFAMWGEHNRLQPKHTHNLNGEDSLRAKIEQLEWITKGTQVGWHLYAVDDGCPHGSADIAEQIAQTYHEEVASKVSVLRLANQVPTSEGPLRKLQSADDSKKGGAIILGCQAALANDVDAVVYTDADNSVHLGQLGMIVEPFANHGKQVVLGNRKHERSVLVKQEERWGIGIKTLRHMQRMIGAQIFDSGIKDTQAAFKLYSRTVLEKILADPTVFDFSFDTDWIFAAMELNQPITTIPFAFIDSAAESASIVQGPMTTWYVLLDGLVKAAKARDVTYSKEMADVFTSEISSHHDLELLIDVLPPELATVSDSDLGNPKIMSPQSVKHWIVSAKQLNSQLPA